MPISIYERLPHWLGINRVMDLILAIVCIVILMILYVLIGGGICPKVLENRWLRATVIILWPIYDVGLFLSTPIVLLVDFSKPQDQQDEELEEFMREVNNEEKW